MSGKLPSEILLVIAMHRSGSSALTRCLNLLGYNTPKTLIEKTKFNVTGHWESKPLARLNDTYLLNNGLQWYNWHRGTLDSVKAKEKNRFKSDLLSLLENEFEADEPAVVKEPRTCRLLPVYQEALKGAKIPYSGIVIFRNPLDVIESLGRRNQMSRKDAALLWLRYVTESVLDSAKIDRVFVSYEELLSQPLTVLRRIEKQLPITFPKKVNDVKGDIEDFLSYDHQHHKSLAKALKKDTLTQGWIERVYGALKTLSKDAKNAEALKIIRSVYNEFQQSAPMLEAIHTPSSPPRNPSAAAKTTMTDTRHLKDEIEKYRMIADVRKEQITALHNDYKDDIRTYENELNELRSHNTQTVNGAADIESVARQNEISRKLAVLETENNAQAANFSNLKAKFEALEDEKKALEAEKARLETIEQDLYQRLDAQHTKFANSTSWKLTKPLRFVTRQIKRK